MALKVLLALSLVASGSVFPGVLAVDGCTHHTQDSVPVGNAHYLWIAGGSVMHTYVELWQESNGIPGLQRVGSTCSGGASHPRDACIVHSVQAQIPSCLASYPGPPA